MHSLLLSAPLLLKIAIFLFALLIFLIALRKTSEAHKLISSYKAALNDLKFFYALEELHCREHIESGRGSLKSTIRKSVTCERELQLTGKLTPNKISNEIKKLETNALFGKSPFSFKLITNWLIKDLVK